MKCPKCGAECPQTFQHKPGADIPIMLDGETQFPTLDDIIASQEARVFDGRFTQLFECPMHGEFGMRQDDSPEFVEPDTWVAGPDGKKLFRM